MKTKLFIVLFLTSFISLTQNSNANYEFGNKKIIGVFDVKEKGKQEIFNSISKWIALNYNSAQDVIQLKNAESGTIIVKGINVSTFENARRKFYKEQYQEKFGEMKFSHTMEINVKDNRFRVIYTLTDAHTSNGLYSANTEVMLGFDMIDFTGLKQDKVDAFNDWVEDLWKTAWIGKNKREKFKATTRPFYEGVIEGVKINIISTMNLIYKNVVSNKNDDW